MPPNDLPALDTTSTYALIATLVGFVIWLARKASPATWAKIPTRWRWVVPITLAGLAAFAEAYQFGRPWQHALLLGIGAGLAAAGGHHALLDSPLPYGGHVLLLLGLSFGVTACASSRPVLATVNQAADLLCRSSPEAQRAAQARGISVGDLCAIHEIAAPFLEEATRAQRTAEGRAGRAMVRP